MKSILIVCMFVMVIAAVTAEGSRPNIVGTSTATFSTVGVHSLDPKGEFTREKSRK